MDKVYDTWCTCHLKLQNRQDDDDDDDGATTHAQPVLYIYYMNKKRSYKEVTLPLKHVSCVHRLKYMTKPHSIGIEMCSNDSQLNKITLSMESDQSVDEWISLLNCAHARVNEGNHIMLFATTYVGDVYKCHIGNSLAVSAYKWNNVKGHLWRVVCGTNGVTWAIGFDGKPYVFTGHNHNTNNNLQNIEEHFIYENQRWNPVEGYADR